MRVIVSSIAASLVGPVRFRVSILQLQRRGLRCANTMQMRYTYYVIIYIMRVTMLYIYI
jgi:hypothetical protein